LMPENQPEADNPVVPPTCYTDILKAGHRRGHDFEIVIGNRNNLHSCLIAAPHGGGIEPLTAEIARAVADVSTRAFYLFLGHLDRNNWNAFHIDSTRFDEPDFTRLAAETEMIVSFHGAELDQERRVYVGGLHEQGRAIMIHSLNAELAPYKILAVDATEAGAAQSIAGLHPNNLTNRGRTGRGIQLEFSEAARLTFFPGKSRAARQQPNEHLPVLARSIDAALQRLTNFPAFSSSAKRLPNTTSGNLR
jgi:phage replication-related protein YjqB (UPF0714/DUF867 family)